MSIRQTKTRATAVAASALIALGLAACSGSGDADAGSSDAATSAAEETPAEETPAEETPAEEDAAAEGDVCSAVASLTDASAAMSDVDPTDLQPTVDKLEELTTTLEGVGEPPAEIADDWNTLTTSFRTASDGLSAAAEDPTDTEAMGKLQEAMSAMTASDFQDAAQSVGTYAGTHC
ncbi:hypothetical protein M1843_04075 [Isoptericola sp. 4D.3]|uniref:Uncharacterized protein n=1 Tax=Isoptericola peretonis TaxID=2918523 RepID=A0ABT0J0A0_9MICO|nr:hypothetical protein [Isoptericola sp. 4D.3]